MNGFNEGQGIEYRNIFFYLPTYTCTYICADVFECMYLFFSSFFLAFGRVVSSFSFRYFFLLFFFFFHIGIFKHIVSERRSVYCRAIDKNK